MTERRCKKCGCKESQHITAPTMCATCAREMRDGAFHAFEPDDTKTETTEREVPNG